MRLIRWNPHAEWDLQRERDWERARALRVMRNAFLFLLFGSAILALAFATAWNQTEGLPVRCESRNWKVGEGTAALAFRNRVERKQ